MDQHDGKMGSRACWGLHGELVEEKAVLLRQDQQKASGAAGQRIRVARANLPTLRQASNECQDTTSLSVPQREAVLALVFVAPPGRNVTMT
jgi:hypothetical protein